MRKYLPEFPYSTYRKNNSVIIAAKASLSRFTGCFIEADAELPTQTNLPRGSHHLDPLAGAVKEKVVTTLEKTPEIRSIAVLDEFLRRYPLLGPSVSRTLEPRM